MIVFSVAFARSVAAIHFLRRTEDVAPALVDVAVEHANLHAGRVGGEKTGAGRHKTGANYHSDDLRHIRLLCFPASPWEKRCSRLNACLSLSAGVETYVH